MESSGSTFGRRGVALLAAEADPAPIWVEPAAWAKPFTLKQLLFSFDGRITRSTYWLGEASLLVAALLLPRIALLLSAAPTGDDLVAEWRYALLGFALLVLVLGGTATILWIEMALVVKRWHDLGRSWRWALLSFVPIVGWAWQTIECGMFEGSPATNRYGPSPKAVLGALRASAEAAVA